MTRADCSENEPPWVPSSWWATSGWAKRGGGGRRGNAEVLRDYWEHGEGAAKIRWGTPGDWTRCNRELTKYLGTRAKGYCNLMHKRMNGYYPGDKRNK